MINLLPPAYALAIRYGRRNSVLRRWIISAVIAIIGLLIILAGGWLYLDKQSKDLSSDIANTKLQLTKQNLAKVQKDAADITADVKVINRVLNSEIRFSALIQDIGKTMPTGTVLGSLSLSKVNGALDLSANAKDYAAATQVAVNLNDPANGLFSRVDIVNISCNNNSNVYKCNATFKALFSTAAQKKYLNVASETKS